MTRSDSHFGRLPLAAIVIMKCQGAQKDKETSQERDDGGGLISEGDRDGDEDEITCLILTTIL